MNLVQLHRQQFVHNVSGQMGGQMAGSVAGTGSGAEEVFYDPKQINAARKFFKKQKRLQKRNNFEYQRQQRDQNNVQQQSGVAASTGAAPADDGSSEVSSVMAYPRPRGDLAMYASSEASKVNNTNIHVDLRSSGMMGGQPMMTAMMMMGGGGGASGSDRKEPVVRHANNPNMLSDSCNESSADLMLDAERFVIGAESLRALTAKRAKVRMKKIISIELVLL